MEIYAMMRYEDEMGKYRYLDVFVTGMGLKSIESLALKKTSELFEKRIVST